MARVRIPTQLRQLTNGLSEVEATAPTVGALIAELESCYPGLQARLLEDGRLRRFVNVYVEDEDVRFLDGLGTPVPDGVVVSIVPAVAGGERRLHIFTTMNNIRQWERPLPCSAQPDTPEANCFAFWPRTPT